MRGRRDWKVERDRRLWGVWGVWGVWGMGLSRQAGGQRRQGQLVSSAEGAVAALQTWMK